MQQPPAGERSREWRTPRTQEGGGPPPGQPPPGGPVLAARQERVVGSSSSSSSPVGVGMLANATRGGTPTRDRAGSKGGLKPSHGGSRACVRAVTSGRRRHVSPPLQTGHRHAGFRGGAGLLFGWRWAERGVLLKVKQGQEGAETHGRRIRTGSEAYLPTTREVERDATRRCGLTSLLRSWGAGLRRVCLRRPVVTHRKRQAAAGATKKGKRCCRTRRATAEASPG